MGDSLDLEAVELVNDGRLVQMDFVMNTDGESKRYRAFVQHSTLFRLLGTAHEPYVS